MVLTGVTATFNASSFPFAAISRWTSSRSMKLTTLFFSSPLFPKRPPLLLLKYSLLVSGTQIGASCAKANVSLDASSTMNASGPRISDKNALWKTWRKGGVVFVGFKRCSFPAGLKSPSLPRTANDDGSNSYTSCQHATTLRNRTSLPQLEQACEVASMMQRQTVRTRSTPQPSRRTQELSCWVLCWRVGCFPLEVP